MVLSLESSGGSIGFPRAERIILQSPVNCRLPGLPWASGQVAFPVEPSKNVTEAPVVETFEM